ncbi:hect-type ubiquitin ligase-interacting cred [Fusarium longipes]|uniref:Hect-type ubiquitin ligase-interacting cred n=1 Tax=Fusarium longipes TaxID=694270 RepID=A0A395SYI8_9HYPO|nr:hect-type ubiquitin ligase-interacting cred [Fusarium longipes]
MIKPTMRSLLAKVTGPRRLHITIKPDHDYIFLSGYGIEAQGQYLRGKIVLFVPQKQHVQGLQLKFTSRMWIGDHATATEEAVKWQHKEETIHAWSPFHITGQTAKLVPNGRQYEWPFELFIRGDQEETFKGCTRCSITYLLEASTIPSESFKDVRSFTPIRIIRTPAFSSYYLMDPASTNGKWSTKAEYNVSIRHRAIALGGLIPIDAEVAQICSTSRIVKARFFLREIHTAENKSVSGCVTYEAQRVVTEWPLDVNESGQFQSWQQCLHLPLAVRNCSPDVSMHGITISHTLHLEVTLITEGVTTKEEVSLPIHLFISPELPVNGWGVFVRHNDIRSKEVKDLLAEGIRIPPRYSNGDFDLKEYGTPIGTPPPAYSEC